MFLSSPRSEILAYVATASQMQQIEAWLFGCGMPVAALMEKVGLLLSQRMQGLFPRQLFPRVGVLVGPGHNGGDALVVARELQQQGYQVTVFHPFTRRKELTGDHAYFATSLGIPFANNIAELRDSDWLVDGLFGFGLDRPLTDIALSTVQAVNIWNRPVVSIDLPSGLHTDSGEILGGAIRASHTLCLGLWKLGLMQDHALAWCGELELLDFGLPIVAIEAILGRVPKLQCLTPQAIASHLPLERPPATHKYQQGHLLLVGGSKTYGGSIVLATLAAKSTGIGMLSVAVPARWQELVLQQAPDAIVIPCPETPEGAIAGLPQGMDLSSFDAIACGPGLTMFAEAVVRQVLDSDCPLILDADGLNILAQLNPVSGLSTRKAPTILTPHPGEFRRLFPGLVVVKANSEGSPEKTTYPPAEAAPNLNRSVITPQAARQTGAIVLLKGARTVVATPDGRAWINGESTPGLARGGSGDVLTGLIGGLLGQIPPVEATLTAMGWHAQAGRLAAKHRSVLGVDARSLGDFLIPALMNLQGLRNLRAGNDQG
ncbi:bifunctional ADP-dependent NAD(P)H-hydrate dehydratase/NAD(P)H-hydrate epimerase [Synechococcus sp. PCC 6312]|uniref:bifunctional ADP-dependent NAD(P)H-hydrate dehydratase/NAD(P)H-hydrate epimerase n=1 Tax=Synechococcus sp. (strain ATCC 27167 / PCC 6312) TaxID=195253 RepID=UPI00029F4787|nr:bifunctional ADP-dependent NAD(P)H-hydrate dehydratase/NAD(P)H-hydrate epimerase [Synechococcus sp. PCC 6312]AFY59898.1 yjeF-like protein, hydroxyethylthiazole kinase-related protein [Synechococcus sp. PCC 6312]